LSFFSFLLGTLLGIRILKYTPLSQHTGTTRARTGADWHTPANPQKKNWRYLDRHAIRALHELQNSGFADGTVVVVCA